jgi:hypothetical protein
MYRVAPEEKVTPRKCQNYPVREDSIWTILGVECEFTLIERVEDTVEAFGRRYLENGVSTRIAERGTIAVSFANGVSF